MKAFITSMAAVIAICVVVTLITLGSWMSNHNAEVSLRAQFDAQQKANHSIFDRTWKIIQQQAQIPEQYGDDFRKTFVEIMQARNPEGQGSLVKFLTEAKVDYTPDLYSKLMTTIEAQRMDFDRSQQKLLDIQLQHTALCSRFPGNVWLSGRSSLEAKIITSEKTEAAFATGQDNESLELFKE